jgi:hypothetical protein
VYVDGKLILFPRVIPEDAVKSPLVVSVVVVVAANVVVPLDVSV